METALDLLRMKGERPLFATSPATTVLEATKMMNDERIGALLVMQDGRLVGMFTERDVLQRVVGELRSPAFTPVRDVMTQHVVCCTPGTAVEEVSDLMRCRRIRHVPVVDGDGGVVGLVSIGDVNAGRFTSCEVALHQVEDYIYRRA